MAPRSGRWPGRSGAAATVTTARSAASARSPVRPYAWGLCRGAESEERVARGGGAITAGGGAGSLQPAIPEAAAAAAIHGKHRRGRLAVDDRGAAAEASEKRWRKKSKERSKVRITAARYIGASVGRVASLAAEGGPVVSSVSLKPWRPSGHPWGG